MAGTTFAARVRPDPGVALVWAGLVGAEVFAVAAYLLFADVRVTDPLVLVYPLVWINVGVWALWRTEPPAAGDRRRLAVGLVAAAYFGVLAVAGGLVDLSPAAAGQPTSVRLAYASLPPGYGPALLYAGGPIGFNLLPYQIVGYLALAYLVYATVLEAAGSAVSGVLGLFTCVSCAWPVLGTVVAGLFGSGSAVYALAASQSYALSTVVFVSAVALLRWRPDW